MLTTNDVIKGLSIVLISNLASMLVEL